MSGLNSRIKNMMDEYNAKKIALIEETKDVIKEEFKKFFDDNPGVHAITWAQYTPYFNDGDECIFGVNDIFYVTTREFEIDECVNRPYDYDFYEHHKDAEVNSIRNQCEGNFKTFVDEILHPIPNEFYQEIYGDHVQVIVTRDGIETEEYEHD